jgi:hypothetical protein
VDHPEYIVFEKAQALPIAVVTYQHSASCRCYHKSGTRFKRSLMNIECMMIMHHTLSEISRFYCCHDYLALLFAGAAGARLSDVQQSWQQQAQSYPASLAGSATQAGVATGQGVFKETAGTDSGLLCSFNLFKLFPASCTSADKKQPPFPTLDPGKLSMEDIKYIVNRALMLP